MLDVRRVHLIVLEDVPDVPEDVMDVRMRAWVVQMHVRAHVRDALQVVKDVVDVRVHTHMDRAAR